MADTVRRVEYYYLTIPDTPGEGERALATLRDGDVDLYAFLAFPTGDGRSQLDLVPKDPAMFAAVAARAGFTLSGAKHAFLVQGDDRIGAAEATTAKLAAAGVNVTAATGVGDGSGRFGMILWVTAVDYERAAGALGV
ncbi:MAG: hypothetical protein ABSC73_02190 [Acidimicrobiales bacterium]|jgi:hypothetical protein